jgi:protein phosphatase
VSPAALRQLLRQLGYDIAETTDVWSECLLSLDAERWHGRGESPEIAFDDALYQMLPSALGRHLLGAHAAPTFDKAGLVVEAPAPPSRTEVAPPRASAAARAGRSVEVATCMIERGLVALTDGGKGVATATTAAKMATAALVKTFEGTTPLAPVRMRGLPMVLAGIQRANKDIFEVAKRDPKLRGMSASIAVALLVGAQAVVSHAGTARAYRLRRGALELLGAAEASSAPPTSKAPRTIGRALGTERAAEPDTSVVAVQPDDVLLLCTAGVHAALSPEELLAILGAKGAPEALTDAILARAREKAGADAGSAAVIRWET